MTKLEAMLKYVSEHNDFYKKRISEYGIKNPLDITQWPVLTRKELQENRYNMFSDGYKAKYYNQLLKRQSSSGSTGVPINVYWDYKDWYASNMCLWRKRWQWYGIKPRERYVIFTLNTYDVKNDGDTIYYGNESKNLLSINVSLIQKEEAFDNVINLIEDFQPIWMYVQPFVLKKLINAYKRTNKHPPKSLRYIESVGELLSPELRRNTIELFDTCFANMYGSEEMNGISFENPKHRMEILHDNVFLETRNVGENDEFRRGNAVITNLHNRAMPLIRYEQGDVIEPEYGNAGTMEIKRIYGRKLEVIELSSGEEVSPYSLLEAVSELNNCTKDMVTDFGFVYHKHSNVLEYIFALSNSAWQESVCSLFENIIKRKLNLNIALKFREYQKSEQGARCGKEKLIDIQEN